VTRRGLVIGAGGVIGLAWSSATLAALVQAAGWQPRDADVLLGTSQGALLVSLLASGIEPAELVAWYRRELPDGHPLRSKPDPAAARSSARAWLPMPAAPGLVLRGLLPGRVRPSVALSGLLPEGRLPLDGFLAPLRAVSSPGEWVSHPATWVVAVDYDSGERTCFGAPGAPAAGIREAVQASCSVPGFSPPTSIGGRRYVDGGVYSSTSADLLAGSPVDEVLVLAPLAGSPDSRPRSAAQAFELGARRLMQRRLAAECAALRKAGVVVRVLTPSAADREAMGTNPLSPKQRIATFEAAMRSGPERVAAALA
jgi:NTE family protein